MATSTGLGTSSYEMFAKLQDQLDQVYELTTQYDEDSMSSFNNKPTSTTIAITDSVHWETAAKEAAIAKREEFEAFPQLIVGVYMVTLSNDKSKVTFPVASTLNRDPKASMRIQFSNGFFVQGIQVSRTPGLSLKDVVICELEKDSSSQMVVIERVFQTQILFMDPTNLYVSSSSTKEKVTVKIEKVKYCVELGDLVSNLKIAFQRVQGSLDIGPLLKDAFPEAMREMIRKANDKIAMREKTKDDMLAKTEYVKRKALKQNFDKLGQQFSIDSESPDGEWFKQWNTSFADAYKRYLANYELIERVAGKSDTKSPVKEIDEEKENWQTVFNALKV